MLKKSKLLKKIYIFKYIKGNTGRAKIIKVKADIFSDFLFDNITGCIEDFVFPSITKLANIAPVKVTLMQI